MDKENLDLIHLLHPSPIITQTLYGRGNKFLPCTTSSQIFDVALRMVPIGQFIISPLEVVATIPSPTATRIAYIIQGDKK